MFAAVVMAPTLRGGNTPGFAPIANWTATSFLPKVGDTIQLTDESTGDPTSWSWTVNGALFSILQNPTFYCSAQGPLTIQLTATNVYGSGSKPQTVNVQPAS